MNSSLTILRPLWATAVRRWTRLSNHQLSQSERETAKQTLSGLSRLRATPKEKPVGAEETLHKQRSHQQFALHHYYDFSLLQFFDIITIAILSSGDLASIKSVHNPRRSSAFSALPTEPVPLPPRWFLQSLQFINENVHLHMDTWIYVTVPFLGRRHSLLKSLELLCFSDKNVDPSPVFSPKMGFLGQVTTGNV